MTGEISTLVVNAFDRENLPVEVYVVEATDVQGGADSRKTTAVLRLVVSDVNDEAPVIRSVRYDINSQSSTTPA